MTPHRNWLKRSRQCPPSLRRCRLYVASSITVFVSSLRHLLGTNSSSATPLASRFRKDAVQLTHPRSLSRESTVAHLSPKLRLQSTNNCNIQINQLRKQFYYIGHLRGLAYEWIYHHELRHQLSHQRYTC